MTDFCPMGCEGRSTRELLEKYFSHLRRKEHKRRSVLGYLNSTCIFLVLGNSLTHMTADFVVGYCPLFKNDLLCCAKDLPSLF